MLLITVIIFYLISIDGYPNNYGLYFSNSSVFSKIGYDIIGKNTKKNPSKSIQNNNVNANHNNKVEDILEQNVVENVIQNLMEATKENNNNINLPISTSNKKNEIAKTNEVNVDTVNVNIKPNNVNSTNNLNIVQKINATSPLTTDGPKEPLVNASEAIMNFNSLLWETLFDLEMNCESKQSFSLTVHRMINILTTKIEGKDLPMNIFSVTQMNTGYNKLMKISFIILVYLKYILLDFNYDITLRSTVKKILNSFNCYLVALIEHYILTKGEKDMNVNNCGEFGKEFIDKYTKILKIHKNKRNNTHQNPVNYGIALNKNCEIVINHIKQMSNSYFKIGYFKPIHNICFEFFRLLDSYTSYQIANLVINNVLYFVVHNSINEKKNNSISNKTIIFNPSSLLNLYGFNNGNIKPPFLPPCSDDTFTLVLDLDETLVHFFYTPSGGAFLIRPGCFDFLREISKIYDIAIFTAAMKDYADNILDILDPDKNLIKYRLYRHHTSISGMCFVKDLSKLGRDLKRIIIIDNLVDNFKLQPNNGLGIKTWLEEMKDNQLGDLGNLLKEIVEKKPNDVRTVIKKIKEEANKRIKKNNGNPYKNLSIDKYI